MNYRSVLLCFVLLLLKVFPAFALRADTLKIFYDIDKYDLSPSVKLVINTFVDSVSEKDTIKVIGYADYLGFEKNNLVLSDNRAETITKYILTRNAKLTILTSGKGEIAAAAKKTDDGEPVNRRVDIIKPKKIPFRKSVAAKAPPLQAKDTMSKQRRIFTDKINTIEKLDVGSSISLEELTFQMGRHYLNHESVIYLNTLLQFMQTHTNIVFKIVGHVCCGFTTQDGYDQDTREDKLSFNRAKYIYDYLVSKGISASRMTYVGLGSTKPKVWPERTDYDEYVNRRVEILILGK